MERYVGVSGIATQDDQLAIDKLATELQFTRKNNAFVMSGVQVTNKTLEGSPNKYGPLWYPVGSQIQQAGLRTENTLPFVHIYSEYFRDLERVIHHADILTQGYRYGWQLNQLPFHTHNLESLFINLRTQYPQDVFVLQCHRESLDKLSPENLQEVVGLLKPEYALLDASHEQGVDVDTVHTAKYIDAMKDLHTRTIVAGGLGPDTVYKVMAELIQINLNLSWDAESKLRSVDPQTQFKILDMLKVQKYLEESQRVLLDYDPTFTV